jgi:hypothetical protein
MKICIKYTTTAVPERAATLDHDFFSYDGSNPNMDPEGLDYDCSIGGQDLYAYPDSPGLTFTNSPA